MVGFEVIVFSVYVFNVGRLINLNILALSSEYAVYLVIDFRRRLFWFGMYIRWWMCSDMWCIGVYVSMGGGCIGRRGDT